MPSMTKIIPPTDPLHKKLVDMLSSRIKLGQKGTQEKYTDWQKAEDTVLAYVPESDMDAKRRTKRENEGEPKYTTIKLPYTFALLMSAHTYLTSVFFARSPVHQFSGRHGETEDQIQAIEALIAYQMQVGELLGPYYLWLYDSLKYGLGVIEEYWEKEMIQFATIQEMPDPLAPDQMVKMQVRAQMEGYAGNKISNISPFNFLPDPRVPVGRFQEGEFVFVRKRLSWETIVRREAQGYYMNVKELRGESWKDFAVGTETADTGSQLTRPEDNTFIMDGEGEKRPSIVVAYEGCVSVIPKEWKLGDSEFPEKWMFTITGDLSTVIGAQPHGAMHGKFPYAILESEIEAYGSFNRGFPEIIEPLQNTLDWLINQHFFNVRAALNNQFIIDPSKIVARDTEDGGPGFVFRLRPEAYGQDIRAFFHQVPVADVTRQHIPDMQAMFGIGEKVFGVNDQIMGALSSSGRKTATEVRTSTGFGVNRLKTLTEYMSATGFGSHSQRLVQNSQQYYDGNKKLKIVGDLLQNMPQDAAMSFMNVTPDRIQGFYDFLPVDGTLPIDRLAMGNLWKDIMFQMRGVPGLLQSYDLTKIFAYVAGLIGVRNVNRFKLQLGSPQDLAQQAQAGNLVPATPGGGSATPNPAGIPTAGESSGASPPLALPSSLSPQAEGTDQ